MDHRDHVALLKPANISAGGIWADLGAGSGAFTLALRELIGADATIYAVDKDGSALKELERAHRVRFHSTDRLILLRNDFSRPFDLPPLDGVVLANSLHYFKDKTKVLRHIAGFLKPGAALIVVEYNVETGNLWVPYPFTFETFRAIALQAELSEPRLLGKHPSRFLHEFYSAVTYNK